jgi:hypothetical protein
MPRHFVPQNASLMYCTKVDRLHVTIPGWACLRARPRQNLRVTVKKWMLQLRETSSPPPHLDLRYPSSTASYLQTLFTPADSSHTLT